LHNRPPLIFAMLSTWQTVQNGLYLFLHDVLCFGFMVEEIFEFTAE